jgi:hypothetical protein
MRKGTLIGSFMALSTLGVAISAAADGPSAKPAPVAIVDAQEHVDQRHDDAAGPTTTAPASPTIGVTQMHGAFWAAPPPLEPATTTDLTDILGAYWAASLATERSAVLTDMYGASWAEHPELDVTVLWLTAM